MRLLSAMLATQYLRKVSSEYVPPNGLQIRSRYSDNNVINITGAILKATGGTKKKGEYNLS